tara:strand:+ start:793 stop:2166 length:1374 start_codon:yes stop_codon:yes gene_type:complete
MRNEKSALGMFSPSNPDYGKNAGLLAFAATMLQNAGRQPFGRGAPVSTLQALGSGALAGLGAYGQAEQQQYARTKPNYQVINDKLVSITPSSERGGTPTIKEIADYGTPTAVKPIFENMVVDKKTQRMVSYDNGVTWKEFGEVANKEATFKVESIGGHDVLAKYENGERTVVSETPKVYAPPKSIELLKTREQLVKNEMSGKNPDGTPMSPEESAINKANLSDINAIIRKEGTTVGLTEYDLEYTKSIAGKRDIHRVKKVEDNIKTFENVTKDITELVDLIEKTPTATGIVGATKEGLAGVIGQFSDLFDNKDWGDNVYKEWDIDNIVEIRNRGKFIVGSILPIITNENNKFTKEERELATEAQGVLQTTSDSRRAIAALTSIFDIVNNRLATNREEMRQIIGRSGGSAAVGDTFSMDEVDPRVINEIKIWLRKPESKNHPNYERLRKDVYDYLLGQ